MPPWSISSPEKMKNGTARNEKPFMTTPQELKQIVSEGLLSFPVTDFDAKGDFRADTYAERLEWLAPYGASALFVAGGTGEFFSLTQDDYTQVVKTAVEVCKGKVPILAGAGGPTRVAIAYAKEAQRLGAHGILLMPHYLTEASQDGIADHAEEVCKAVPGMTRRTFDPGFRIELHQKDLNLALSTAQALGVSLPNTAICQALFNACVAHGGKAWDHSAMVRALEVLANHEIGQKSA